MLHKRKHKRSLSHYSADPTMGAYETGYNEGYKLWQPEVGRYDPKVYMQGFMDGQGDRNRI